MTSSLYGQRWRSDVILRLSEIFKGYFGGDDRDERVRRKLVETLYTQTTSLAVGAVAGIACAATAIADDAGGNELVAAEAGDDRAFGGDLVDAPASTTNWSIS